MGIVAEAMSTRALPCEGIGAVPSCALPTMSSRALLTDTYLKLCLRVHRKYFDAQQAISSRGAWTPDWSERIARFVYTAMQHSTATMVMSSIPGVAASPVWPTHAVWLNISRVSVSGSIGPTHAT